jgi:hypothetical protein
MALPHHGQKHVLKVIVDHKEAFNSKFNQFSYRARA